MSVVIQIPSASRISFNQSLPERDLSKVRGICPGSRIKSGRTIRQHNEVPNHLMMCTQIVRTIGNLDKKRKTVGFKNRTLKTWNILKMNF